MQNDGAARMRHISNTALWVAAYRAEESERRDALFHDPYARRLAGERGFGILDSMPKGRRNAWPMVACTVIIGRLIRERIAKVCDLVLNLVAGVYARPYRMNLLERCQVLSNPFGSMVYGIEGA